MTNRQFTAQADAGQFVITEVANKTWTSVDRQTAWDRARSQANPVVFVALDGTRTELGDAFNAEQFERAMYTGHISYQLSMTDGYYAPESFDRWVHWFRQEPSTRYNDATPEVKAAMIRYQAA